MLRYLPPGTDPKLLIGLGAPDDAAVYQLSDDVALVASIDFFTPLVDDAEDFGAIAAANALSDLYAMRATPLFALSVLAIPAGTLPDALRIDGLGPDPGFHWLQVAEFERRAVLSAPFQIDAL